jgi:hypothetical protein
MDTFAIDVTEVRRVAWVGAWKKDIHEKPRITRQLQVWQYAITAACWPNLGMQQEMT